MSSEDDYLLISGIDNFAYCKRRWALVHIEKMWNETSLTMEGHFMHEVVHDNNFTEKRGNLILSRGMRVVSHKLKITGECDMVELRKDIHGVNIVGRQGKYLITPVEYKLGKPNGTESAEMQLCAQAICLEEMFCTNIDFGELYYARIKKRVKIAFTDELRNKVIADVGEMNEYMKRQYTPKVKRKGSCSNCSMKDLCNASILKLSASGYVRDKLKEDCNA